MKKYRKIIIINLLILIFLAIVLEIIMCIFSHIYYAIDPKKIKPHISYTFNPIYVHRLDLTNYFTGADNSNEGRAPDGLEYSGTPIIVFGCSYAHGQFLEQDQTLSALLSKKLKRPVYNRAIPGQGLQEMYYQSTLEEFYTDIKDADTVIYVMINDQYRRMYMDYFDMSSNCPLLNYKIKRGNLTLKDYNNPIINFFRSIYTVRFIQTGWVNKYILNYQNSDKITDDALLYFVKTRENLEKHYKHKIKFCVIFYERDSYGHKLYNKLKRNGFVTLNIRSVTKEDLTTRKYKQPNKHPTSQAWELLITPIVKSFFNEKQ